MVDVKAPQKEKTLKIEISIGQRGAVLLVAGLLILLLPIIPTTESLTLTTYYPAPYGAYRELRATESAFLAYSGGQVGIGTTNPQVQGVGLPNAGQPYLADIDGHAQVRRDLRVGGSLILNGYITLAQPSCSEVAITGASSSCAGGRYATTTPGLYQPGKVLLTQTKWMYQDGPNPPTSWPKPGGSFWCCDL